MRIQSHRPWKTRRLFALVAVWAALIGCCGNLLAQQTDPLGRPIKPKNQPGKTKPGKAGTEASENKTQVTQEIEKGQSNIEAGTGEKGQGETAMESQSVLPLPGIPSGITGLSDQDLKSYQPGDADAPSQQRGMRMADGSTPGADPLGNAENAADQLIKTRSVEGESIPASHGQFQLVKRSTERWVFGLAITATGDLKGGVATAPVPIEWDEQKIRVVRTFKSPTVSRVTMKQFPGQGQQMIVTVPQLASGQTAEASITLEIDRYDILPPEHTQSFQFPEKGNRAARPYLGESPYIESKDKRIQELADTIVDPQETPWNQVQSIYDWVQQNIQYRFDPQIHSCLEALDSKTGDCEEVASLFIALCRARGIPARAVWCNDHTYPEFMLCTEDGKDVWFPCQITTTEHMFGMMYDDRPILQKGDEFKIMGEHAPNRYLKPAMNAKRALGSPTFRWIIEKAGSDEEAPGSSPLDTGL